MKFLRFDCSKPVCLPQSFLDLFQPQQVQIEAHENVDATELASLYFPFPLSPEFGVRLTINDVLSNCLAIRGTHTKDVIPFGPQNAPADGFYDVRSDNAPIGMALKTADCLAVAVVAKVSEQTFSSLFHAGWRGFTAGIHINAFEKMLNVAAQRGVNREQLFSSLEVFIAPAIFGSSYPCGSDVASAFLQHEASGPHGTLSKSWSAAYGECKKIPGPLRSVNDGEEKIYPDLQALMCLELSAMGVAPQNMTVFRENTYGHPLFKSYRFACNTGKGKHSERNVTHLLGFQKA